MSDRDWAVRTGTFDAAAVESAIPCNPYSMNKLNIRIASGAAELSRDTWNDIGEPGHPFLNADFLRIVEERGVAAPESGWQPLHLVATQEGTDVGLLPLYLKSHSHGDFIY